MNDDLECAVGGGGNGGRSQPVAHGTPVPACRRRGLGQRIVEIETGAAFPHPVERCAIPCGTIGCDIHRHRGAVGIHGAGSRHLKDAGQWTACHEALTFMRRTIDATIGVAVVTHRHITLLGNGDGRTIRRPVDVAVVARHQVLIGVARCGHHHHTGSQRNRQLIVAAPGDVLDGRIGREGRLGASFDRHHHHLATRLREHDQGHTPAVGGKAGTSFDALLRRETVFAAIGFTHPYPCITTQAALEHHLPGGGDTGRDIVCARRRETQRRTAGPIPVVERQFQMS